MFRGKLNTLNPVNRNHPLAQGLVLWMMGTKNNGAGKSIYDLMGRQVGTFNGNAVWIPSVLNNDLAAVSYDGVNSYISIPGTSFPSITKNFTFSALVKPLPQAAPVIFGQSNTAQTFQFRIGSGFGDGSIQSFINGAVKTNSNTGFAVDNVWQLITITNDSTGFERIFVNGKEVTYAVQATFTYTSSLNAKQIGQRGNSTGFWQGGIDDVKIYNRGLSPVEVMGLYTNSIMGFPQLLRRVKPLNNTAVGAVVTSTQSQYFFMF